jgi:hypothetical protein
MADGGGEDRHNMLFWLKLAGNDPASLVVLDREAGSRKGAAGAAADEGAAA